MGILSDIFYNDLTLKCDKWLHYFKVYEECFEPFRNKDITFVEVGVQGGGSMQLWRKYFGEKAKIHGIDIDERVLEHTPNYDNNIKIHIGDQKDQSFWDKFLKEVPEIDIFIDDGGHTTEQQIVTLECVFPKLKYGGIYVCEDTHTSYYSGYTNTEYNFYTYLSKLNDLVHTQFNGKKFSEAAITNYDGLYNICLYNSMVVINKRKPEKIERDVVNENERFK